MKDFFIKLFIVLITVIIYQWCNEEHMKRVNYPQCYNGYGVYENSAKCVAKYKVYEAYRRAYP